MAYVPIALILAGMTAYTVLAGADFGAGLWTLLAPGLLRGRVRRAAALRDHARHAMGPVWEANHVWLVFVLVVCWTGYPVAFGSIMSTLSVPLLIAVFGITMRGAAYALRSLEGSAWFAEGLLGTSSVLTPFALATAVGAIALGRVPVGNAAGNLLTSWFNPACVLIGVLAVAFSGYLSAVYLAADAERLMTQHQDQQRLMAERPLASAFRNRALVSGLASGILALAGVLVMRSSGLSLLHGVPLVFVIVSGLAGLATMALCFVWQFALARLTAAAAVAAVVLGWATAQSPRFLPGLTVAQAAAGRSVLIALIIAVCAGALFLVPSLVLLFTLFLRGRLETPEDHGRPARTGTRTPARPAHPNAQSTGSGHAQMRDRAAAMANAHRPARGRGRGWGTLAVAGLIGGVGLMIFADPLWAHLAGAVLLIACAVSVFALTAGGPDPEV